MKEIFIFIAFIFGNISLIFAQDNWGEQGGYSGSSISGADKDAGIFVGRYQCKSRRKRFLLLAVWLIKMLAFIECI